MFLFLAFFGAFTSPLVFALNSQMISNAANSFLNKKNSCSFFCVYNLSVWRFCLSVNLFRLFLMKPVLLHSLALIRLSRRFLLLWRHISAIFLFNSPFFFYWIWIETKGKNDNERRNRRQRRRSRDTAPLPLVCFFYVLFNSSNETTENEPKKGGIFLSSNFFIVFARMKFDLRNFGRI